MNICSVYQFDMIHTRMFTVYYKVSLIHHPETETENLRKRTETKKN